MTPATSRELAKKIGVSAPTCALARNGRDSAKLNSALRAIVGVDPRNAVSIFELLARRELIGRSNDQKDRRRQIICLTGPGLVMIEDLKRAGAAIERDFLASLTTSEQAVLHELLSKLLDATTELA